MNFNLNDIIKLAKGAYSTDLGQKLNTVNYLLVKILCE